MEANNEHAPKRQKLSHRSKTGRRKAACQTCSVRKIRCDGDRPACSSCQTTGSACVYTNEPDTSLTYVPLRLILLKLTAITDLIARSKYSVARSTVLRTRLTISPPSITKVSLTAQQVPVVSVRSVKHKETMAVWD